MIGVVNIRGDIGDLSEITGTQSPHTTLLDLITQVESNKTATEFHVFINSKGGLLSVGYKMFQYLKSLTIPITTFIENECCSIATAPFLAGQRRVIREGSKFMVHAPLVLNMTGNADILEEEMKALRDEEKEMVNFYHQQTGASKEALTPLIQSDTFLTADQAIQLGFATEKETLIKTEPLNKNIKAVAYSDTFKNKKQMSEALTKEEQQSWFNKLLAKADTILEKIKGKPVAIVLQDASGVEIDFPDVEEGQSPEVGSAGLIEGSAVPNMEGSTDSIPYPIPSLGATITFRDGMVWQIMPDDDDATAALKTEIEQLKGQVAEKEGELTAVNTDKEEIKTQVLGLKTELGKFKALAGKIEPEDKKKNSKKDDGSKKSSGLMKAEWYKKN